MSTHPTWAQRQQELLPRLSILEQAALAAVEGRLDSSGLEGARREAHRLAGSLGVLNLPAASRQCRELEQVLQPGVDAHQVSQLVWKLVQAVERGPDHDATGLAERLVIYVGPAPPQTPGLRLVAIRELDELRRLLLEGAPELALLESDFPSDDDLAATVCRHLRAEYPELPLLALFSPEQSLSRRVRAINCGVSLFLERGLDPASLVRELRGLLTAPTRAAGRILVIDDDPVQTRMLEEHLKKQHFSVAACCNPVDYERALEEQHPDLIILDLEMPGMHGLEICRRLRAHPRWRTLPILVCTAHREPEVIRSLFLAGADDYLLKPALGVELVARVRNRLQRAQSTAPLVSPESGVLTLPVAHIVMERGLALARRQGLPVTLVRLDLNPARLREYPGLLARVARHVLDSIRHEDVLTIVAEHALLAGLYGSTAVDAATRLRKLIGDWHKFIPEAPQPTVALVEFPTDGQSLESLLQRLGEVCEQAHLRGLVLHSPNLPQDAEILAETLDVVVVEDDEMLAQIEMHALRTRGYRCRWIADGDTAARELTGKPPRIRPRLVLMDVDLPGQTGLQVLHAMKAGGALRGGRTKVIVVTVRANEAEVLESLESGAIDHVVKPFSVSALMSRVALALRP